MAETFAGVINAFVEQISWKTMVRRTLPFTSKRIADTSGLHIGHAELHGYTRQFRTVQSPPKCFACPGRYCASTILSAKSRTSRMAAIRSIPGAKYAVYWGDARPGRADRVGYGCRWDEADWMGGAKEEGMAVVNICHQCIDASCSSLSAYGLLPPHALPRPRKGKTSVVVLSASLKTVI